MSDLITLVAPDGTVIVAPSDGWEEVDPAEQDSLSVFPFPFFDDEPEGFV